jgi:tetratricopeptide (TPR) repeat protein
VVTFNGKAFDVPLLESRYRLCREPFPLAGTPHLDLLHPARRLWKLRLAECRLTALERGLLGFFRQGDVPGEDIPRIYFEYVRSRDGRALARVLAHNHRDIVSLAALSALAAQWVEEAFAEDPRDVLSLARVLDRAQQFDRSAEHYERAAAVDAPPDVRTAALRHLARQARRRGDHDEAVARWREAARLGDAEAYRALAVHLERRAKDVEGALAAVDDGLAALGDRRVPGARALRLDLERRRDRLRAGQVQG